jgi:hypothetical protein
MTRRALRTQVAREFSRSLREATFASADALPAREVLVEVSARTLLTIGFECVELRDWGSPAIREHLHFARGLEDGASDCYANSVLACALVVRISGTRTLGWSPILDGDAVLVLTRVRVARIPNDDIALEEGEFEGLVLSAL